jgi:lysine-specific demethylase/histidyl-hydroxylase NO66
MPPAAKKRKQSAAGGDAPSSSKGKAPAPPPDPATAAAADGSDEDSDYDRASLDDAEDDLEGLVGEVLNGEIDDADAANGASHSAVDVLRSGFDPIVVEDARGEAECDDGHALADAGDAEALMQWLVAPADLDDFMRHTWERRAMYVSRNENKNYYAGLLSKDIIDAWLKAGKMRYGVNVDVTSYVDGTRATHNLNDDGSGGVDPSTNETGVAHAATVWRRFEKEKCSLRVLHPQRWRDPLWKQLAAMETFWKCSTGCNAYLTPPDSQGFSPHFDDIDAFVLQLEGKKMWKVYPPRSESEMLPRYSSPNFEQGEIGEPVLEAVLEPGDLLYMPRGTVHQACCVPGAHSLHVTISTNQFNTWADILELAFPQALQQAVAEVPALRRCPPPDLLDALGVAAAGDDASAAAGSGSSSRREALLGVLTELAGSVMRRLPFDDAVDQLGKRLMRQMLPPPPSHLSAPKSKSGAEIARTVTDASRVRLMREGAARLALEDGAVAVYHPFENGRLYHMEGGDEEDEVEGHLDDDDAEKEEDEEPGALFFDPEAGPALELLLLSEDAADDGVVVGDVPLQPETRRTELVKRLVAAGVLAVVR